MVFVLRAFTGFQKVEKVFEFDQARAARNKAQAFETPPTSDSLGVPLDQRAGLDVGQESAGTQVVCVILGGEGRFN